MPRIENEKKYMTNEFKCQEEKTIKIKGLTCWKKELLTIDLLV